jgi:4-alpha-glucanotransferase
MFVVQFEASDNRDRPLPEVPKSAVATLNTHDMPPFRAYWEGLDADLRHELGLIDERGVAEARVLRARTAAAISRLLGARTPLTPADARRELLRFLAASPADMVLINLEDLWLETEPQNVPGTSQERPNWRRRLKYTLSEIRQNADVRELLAMVEAERRKNG